MSANTWDVYRYGRITNLEDVVAEGGYWTYRQFQTKCGFLDSFNYYFSTEFKRNFYSRAPARFYLRQVCVQLTPFLSPVCPFTGRKNFVRKTRLVLVCEQIVDLLGRWVPLAHCDDLEVPTTRPEEWLTFVVDEEGPLYLGYTKALTFRLVESNGLYSRRLYSSWPCRVTLNTYFEVRVGS